MKKSLVFICKNIVFFCLMLIMNYSEIGGIKTFVDGLYASFVLLGENIYIVSFLFLLAGFIFNHSVESFVINVGVVVGVCLVYIILCALKKNNNYFYTCLALFGGECVRFFFLSKSEGVYIIILNIIFALISCYICFISLRPIIKYGLRYKLIEAEGASICILLIMIGIGLSKIQYMGVSLFYIFMGCLCVLMSALSNHNTLVLTVSCLGIGGSFASGDIKFLALACFTSCVVSLFYSRKIFVLLSGLMAITIFELCFFTSYDRVIFTLISFAIGGIGGICIPKKLLTSIKNSYFTPHSKLAMRHLINRNRKHLSNELIKFSDIFNDMSVVLKQNFGTCNKQEGDIALFVRDNVCSKCENFSYCKEHNLEDGIIKLVDVTLKKGRATVVDLPELVGKNCIHLAQLISLTSQKVQVLRKSMEKQENNNEYKRNLSLQLEGLKALLNDMAIQIASPVSYDLEKEKILLSELNSHNIVCSECTVIEGDEGEITLLVKTDTIFNELIEKIICSLTKTPYMIKNIENSLISGYSMVYAVPLTKFDAIFGCSSLALKGQIGDTHSFTKIGSAKFMMALCDGMGSGEKANVLSSTAIGLVESFYKAGLDSDVILESINRFLSLTSDESFSALDILVADLNSGEADLIKIGAPSSYIKKRECVDIIDGACLPLGCVETIKPTVTFFNLEDEFVIFVSDGVSDCFMEDGLAQYINNLSTTNPQKMAQSILDYSLERTNAQSDDMTVVVCKIFQR